MTRAVQTQPRRDRGPGRGRRGAARKSRILGALAGAALILTGCATDHGPAVADTRAQAQAGDLGAQLALAADYDSGKGVQQDYAEAVRWYARAAESGDKVAENNLGTHYLGGLGVSRDPLKALELFRKSAAQGFPQAEYSLGMMCELGLGAAQDRRAAVQWYQKAAEQGVPEAMLNLGLDCHDGSGVPRSAVEAYKWIDLARLFAQDGARAETRARIQTALSALKGELSKDEIEEARARSYDWYERYQEEN